MRSNFFINMARTDRLVFQARNLAPKDRKGSSDPVSATKDFETTSADI